ncbi:hypothetical protein E1B28_005722 [Marasmius oreades]|uniref:Uncharacterized protein n=1 Tax=Marasmius oreades TaxID=181124 RepID=A0A9P7S3R3_9AGAR|nr:uncharacterized protein E1B28_005722 [Marasmius oreades]KAG7094916.1 hypothetical protein E1B28_005722 [Marasmius oreades]
MRPVITNNGGCSWIQDNVFNVQRDNGQDLKEALLEAIDTTANMVWADEPMNQAKSNVVGSTRGSAGEPPQKESIDIIGDFDGDDNLIFNVEFFIRSMAALGDYFGSTSGIYRATAERVQNLLSEVTPDNVIEPTQSLPMIFNSWLRGTVSAYPNGCTSRANNIWNYYRQHMGSVAQQQQTNVPMCFAVYDNYARLGVPFNPSSFTYQNLVPTPPRHPGCNVPGTKGTVGYFVQNNFVTHLTGQRVMGAGNTDFYALGSGDRLSPGQSRWQAVDFGTIPGTSSSCANVYAVNDFPPTTAQPAVTVNIAFQCGTATGKQNANFAFVLNGQAMGCAKYETGHAGGTTVTILCAVNQGSALACAQASGGNGATIQMAFVP